MAAITMVKGLVESLIVDSGKMCNYRVIQQCKSGEMMGRKMMMLDFTLGLYPESWWFNWALCRRPSHVVILRDRSKAHTVQ